MSGGLLVVTAHPDDEVLIAGGVLAACADAGVETGVLCLTRGESGPIADPSLATPATLGSVRERELQDACLILGVDWVRCVGRRDGWLSWEDEDVPTDAIAAALAERRPRAVVTFGDDGLYWHPDHIAVHRLTRAAAARDADTVIHEAVWPSSAMTVLTAILTERGLPNDLWDIDPDAFGTGETEHVVEIDVTPFLDRKLRALRAHATQLGPNHAFRHIPADLAERFLGIERFRAAGPGAGWLAETAGRAQRADA